MVDLGVRNNGFQLGPDIVCRPLSSCVRPGGPVDRPGTRRTVTRRDAAPRDDRVTAPCTGATPLRVALDPLLEVRATPDSRRLDFARPSPHPEVHVNTRIIAIVALILVVILLVFLFAR